MNPRAKVEIKKSHLTLPKAFQSMDSTNSRRSVVKIDRFFVTNIIVFSVGFRDATEIIFFESNTKLVFHFMR